MAGFKMDDYVDVAERINEFSEKFPDGSLQSELIPQHRDGVLVGWLCKAFAYRNAADERPGIGHAYEPVPGKTPYTKDSEAMNAETSAWGRAIVALGFRTKKIASAQEVRARSGATEGTVGRPKAGKAVEAPAPRPADPAPAPAPAAAKGDVKFASEAQRKRLFAIAKENNVESSQLRTILEMVTGQQSTSQIPTAQYDAVVKAVELAAVPFE